MNLRDLEYLVALAEHRHFGRAAAACFVSQPTLSTQLKKLETHLGVPLVERSPRNVLLTPAGEQIVERAKEVLAAARDIRRIARRATDPRAGTVRLGFFPTLGPYLLPHVVGRLHAELPDLEILLVEEKSTVLLDQLRAGELDAAVLALPVPDEAFHVEPLFREDFVMAVPADHSFADGTGPVHTEELSGQDVLLLADGHCLREQALEVCSLTGARERGGFRATSLETLRNMVAAGVGVTLLPRLAVEPPAATSPGIAIRPFAGPVPSRDIVMLWRPTSADAELLRDLAGLVAAVPDGLVHPVPHHG